MSDPPTAHLAPPDMLSGGAAAAILAALPGARAVGGMVRDVLAGLPVQDIDIAAPLPPDGIMARLRAAGLRVFETGLAHGTVTAVLDRQPVEVTSLRRDVTTDGRHAEVEWTTDWREDAARRDFTINAMSMAADGRLWDYFDGRADLAAGRVRFVGEPATRLREDALRALRFFRFQARYGRGAADPAAIAAIREAVPSLARLSAERVWMELKRLLAVPDPVAAVALMAESGVLDAVLPEGFDSGRLARLVTLRAPASPMLRFAALLAPEADIEPVARRLRWSGEERVLIEAARDTHRAPSPGADAAALRRWLAQAGPGADWRLWIAEIERGGTGWPELRDAVGGMPPVVFPLRGADVVAVGVPPGPLVGDLIGAVRDWWLAGGCTANREACLANLRELAAVGPV